MKCFQVSLSLQLPLIKPPFHVDSLLLTEHLLRVAPEARVKGSAPPSLIPPHRLERSGQPQGYSFGVLRSDPASSSLTHITSSATLPYQPTATEAAGRATASVISDGEDDGIGLGKKHVCKTCNKRFNRPSSLRIHINTHTGATRTLGVTLTAPNLN